MGKIITKVKLWNILDEDRVARGEVEPLEIDALVDTGATWLTIPEEVAQALSLRRGRKVKVRLADSTVIERDTAIGVRIKIQERDATLDAIINGYETTPLVGQVVLELLDLYPDPKVQTLKGRPESPDSPIIDLL